MTVGGDGGELSRTGGSTSRSLLAAARGADVAAWERLVRLYAPLAASWCRRLGVAEQDIADVLQEVFAAAALHLDRFRKEEPGDSFRGWLATITRNKIRDHFRRRSGEAEAAGGTDAARRLRQLPDARPLPDNGCAEDVAVRDGELLWTLEAIRGEFHGKTWEAFRAVVIDGRSAADVAADLGMSPGAVRVAKSRVLLRLRRQLGPPGQSTPDDPGADAQR